METGLQKMIKVVAPFFSRIWFNGRAYPVDDSLINQTIIDENNINSENPKTKESSCP